MAAANLLPTDDPRIVWHAILDHRYLIEVQRTGERTAELFIFDQHNNNQELLRESVPLYYGAPFGPDVEDVCRWEERCANFVDALSN